MRSINNTQLTAIEATFPKLGAWTATAYVSSSENLSIGSASLVLDSVTLSCSIVLIDRSSVGRHRLTLVGGNGGMSRVPAAKNWAASTTVRDIVLYLLNSADGATLSPNSTQSILNTRVERYSVMSGIPVGEQLKKIVSQLSGVWRIADDGSVLVTSSGPSTASAIMPKDSIIKRTSLGTRTLQCFTLDVIPSVGSLLDGAEITSVSISANKTSTSLTLSTAAVDTSSRVMDDMFSRSFPARVVKQNGQLFELAPDDAVIRGSGMGSVRYRPGVPFLRVDNVPPGTRCTISFDNSDGSRPFISSWESDNSASRNVARIGDTTITMLTPAIFTGMIGGSPATGMVVWSNPQAPGSITSGHPLVKLS